MNDLIFDSRDLFKTYTHEGAEVPVLKGASFSVARGESLAVMGESGSGKSTLLHVLGGLEAPTRGRVLFEGEDLYAKTPDARALWRNRRLGFVFQFHHLLGEFTALENVALPLLIRGTGKKEAVAKAEALFSAFNLSHRLHHRPAAMSGGERQRVALARALVGEPDVLLADEPTGSLDHDQGMAVIEHLLESKRRRRMSVVMVTHNEHLAGLFGRVLHLSDGKLQ